MRSEPPGAIIFLEGRELGSTPFIFNARRSWSGKDLELVHPLTKKRQAVRLTPHYRWGEGFWGNLLFLTYAPIGWGLDLITQAAFEFEPLPFVTLISPVKQKSFRFKNVAVARPFSESFDEESLESMGSWLAADLQKQWPKGHVIPYVQTKNDFERLERAFDRDPDWRELRNALGDLSVNRSVTDVVVSEVFQEDESIRLRWKALGIEDGQTEDGGVVVVPDDQVTPVRHGRWGRRMGLWFRLLPNNLGLEATSDQVELAQLGGHYNGKSIAPSGWLGKVGEALSGLHVAYAQPPTSRRNWQFRFRFPPMLMVRHGRLHFPDMPGNEHTHFTRFMVFAGWGIQVGWSSRWGQPYASWHLGPSFTHIEWNRSGAQGVEQINAVSSSIEAGYIYFVTDALNLRIFSRVLEENPVVWTRATTSASTLTSAVQASSMIYSGISLSYYFPEHRHPGRWLFGEE